MASTDQRRRVPRLAWAMALMAALPAVAGATVWIAKVEQEKNERAAAAAAEVVGRRAPGKRAMRDRSQTASVVPAETPAAAPSLVFEALDPAAAASVPVPAAEAAPRESPLPAARPARSGGGARADARSLDGSGQLVRETIAFRKAIEALRAGAPGTALAALDRYEVQHPGGTFAREARVARIEALLVRGTAADRKLALARLDEEDVGRLPRGLELRALRGELRAAAGRCADARADFDEVLRQRPGGRIEQRALAGRARCAQPAARP